MVGRFKNPRQFRCEFECSDCPSKAFGRLWEGVRKPVLKAAFRDSEPLATRNYFANKVKPAPVEVQVTVLAHSARLGPFYLGDPQLV